MRLLIFIGLLFFASMHLAFSQDGASYVRKGNREFDKGKFYEAELEYRKAMQQAGNSTKAQFNLGGALFRQEKYDETLKNYAALAERTDVSPELRASALYNLGNTLFKQEHFKESAEAYKQALRLNPGAKDIKYNLSAALRKLQQDQQNQQNQNKDQNQENKNEQQKQDQKGGGEGSQQNNQDNNEKNNQNNNNENQQQNQQQGKEQGNNKDSQQKQQQGSEGQQQNDKATGMTQENAAQLLKALENQEGALQEKVQKAKAKARAKTKTDKDW